MKSVLLLLNLHIFDSVLYVIFSGNKMYRLHNFTHVPLMIYLQQIFYQLKFHYDPCTYVKRLGVNDCFDKHMQLKLDCELHKMFRI